MADTSTYKTLTRVPTPALDRKLNALLLSLSGEEQFWVPCTNAYAEERPLSTYEVPPPFWKRYVDGTVTALPRERVQDFHAHLTTIEASIQFTVAEETDNTLPFLGTRNTHHSDCYLTTTVVQKSTLTGKYLDFQSHHPLAHKWQWHVHCSIMLKGFVQILPKRKDRSCGTIMATQEA